MEVRRIGQRARTSARHLHVIAGAVASILGIRYLDHVIIVVSIVLINNSRSGRGSSLPGLFLTPASRRLGRRARVLLLLLLLLQILLARIGLGLLACLVVIQLLQIDFAVLLRQHGSIGTGIGSFLSLARRLSAADDKMVVVLLELLDERFVIDHR